MKRLYASLLASLLILAPILASASTDSENQLSKLKAQANYKCTGEGDHAVNLNDLAIGLSNGGAEVAVPGKTNMNGYARELSKVKTMAGKFQNVKTDEFAIAVVISYNNSPVVVVFTGDAHACVTGEYGPWTLQDFLKATNKVQSERSA